MDFFLRILIAALLGGLIGLEREYRAKEAGFRTHFLVAMGAALFMILSAHGFEGVLTSDSHSLDVSRIAAQVVSGIGFIGAGTIIFQRHAVRGLTTAAGLWVTAAIGMAAGAGMHLLAAETTVLVLLGLEALNFILSRIGHRQLTVTFVTQDRQLIPQLLEQLRENDIDLDTYSMNEQTAADGQKLCNVSMELRVSRRQYRDHILRIMTQFQGVSVETIG